MNIKKLTTQSGYRLQLEFADGVTGIVDLSNKVGIGVFAAWQNIEIFARAYIGECGQVEWPGNIELCPDALYLEVTGHLPVEFARKAEPAHA